MKKLVFASIFLLLTIPCSAEIIIVDKEWPYDFNNIQAAIDDANDGDTVYVAPGTYTGTGNYDIDFKGKAITVRSQSGPDNCIIDCNRHTGFNFHGGEDVNSILKGFTITDGYGRSGGAISCDNSSPKIIDCIITGNGNPSNGAIYCQSGHPEIIDCNITTNSGSGIFCSSSNALITGCKISGNSTGRSGGGIYCEWSNPTVTNCIISGNIANSYGGGIFCDNYSNLTAANCTITGNSASSYGGGIYCGSYGSSKISHCIFWNNAAQSGPEIYGKAAVTYSDIRGGCWGQGNINADPLLAPDGRLQAGSPCIDSGNPDFLPELGQVDIDGQPRIMGGRVDIGADEVTAPLVSAIILSSKNFYFHFSQGGPAPGPQILSIRNIREDTLNWEVTEDCPWLEVAPNTGSSTDEPSDITLSVDITGLAAGVYNCTLTISSPDAAPRLVPVALCVYSPEMLLVPIEYPTIQSAIDASFYPDFNTVVVLPGTYTGDGNRDIDFLGKAITVRSVNPNDPNIIAQTIIDCNGLDGGFYFHGGEDANSVLAGFTITNGAGDGAISCSSSPTIANCIITKNTSHTYGGITCFSSSSRPAITDCTISGNSVSGIYCELGASPVITNCTITDNTGSGRSPGNGGGIYCYESSPKITTCTISGNYVGSGGGIYCRGSSNPVVTSCTITGNSAKSDGGGIYCDSTSGSKVTNCTISGNAAKRNGGGIFLASTSLSIPVTSSIIWGNADNNGTGLSAQIYSGKPFVWFSCIKDDNPNDANIPFDANNFNIDDDPCFVEPGFWDANVWHDGDYHLLPASPCVETGDPYLTYHAGDVDMDGQPRLMGQYVDMGADEFEIAMIVVTKPQAGIVWVAGSTHKINWDSYDITGTVDIYYSDNNDVDWVKIDNVPDTGIFAWHLPEAVDSNCCLVSVEPNVPVPNLICTQSGLFTIHSCSPGPQVSSKWKSLGGDFDRAGLSQNFGPELGCIKWQFQTNGPVSASPSIGSAGRVHLSCEDGNLYTLDANGALLWSYDTNSPLLSSPTIGPDGSLYVGAENGKLYAFDIDGNLRWTHNTNDSIYSSPAVSPDGNVYACSQDGTLYALGRDGSELWIFDTDSSNTTFTGAVFASPAIGLNGTIYIAGLYDPNLYALDANTGSVKWSRSFLDPCDPNSRSPRPFASPVIAADGTVYISPLFDPNLYAVDSDSGNIIWSITLADPCYPYKYVWSEPALAPDGTIYVSFNDPYLRAVNPNGTIKWVTRLGMMGGFTLTVGSDGLIYAASDDAYLCVIGPDGKEIARFKGGSWLSFPVITADNTMIVSDANNTVWAIGGSGCDGQAAALHRPQDLSADRSVNLNDLALTANDWLKQYPDDGIYFTGDIDRDLYVDFADLAELADKWLSQE